MRNKIKFNKIPPKLHSAIMDQHANGLKQIEIVAWLEKEHGVIISRPSVHRLIARISNERHEVTQGIWIEAVAKTAVSDIEILAENTEILRKLRDKAVVDGNPAVAVKCAAELKSHISLKMSISGVETSNEADEDEREDLAQSVSAFTSNGKSVSRDN